MVDSIGIWSSGWNPLYRVNGTVPPPDDHGNFGPFKPSSIVWSSRTYNKLLSSVEVPVIVEED